MAQENLHLRNLLRRIAETDDKEAFALFFTQYYPRMLQFARLFVHSHIQAEDVVSEVLIRLLRRRRELYIIENFQGYLFQAVKNEALNQLKVSKKQQSHIQAIDNENDYLVPAMDDPCRQLIENELQTKVLQVVESLPPRRKMVYKLVKEEGMRYKEVADLLSISERTVEEHLKIAIRELREAITGYLQDKEQKPNISFMTLLKTLLPIFLFWF